MALTLLLVFQVQGVGFFVNHELMVPTQLKHLLVSNDKALEEDLVDVDPILVMLEQQFSILEVVYRHREGG